MNSADALAAHVREACAGFHAELATLSAELLNAVHAAHEILAPIADEPSPAGAAAGQAFQILADAIASAAPPESTPNV